MKKIAVINYVKLRQIYDCFGGVFFGYVRAMNIAHQGWLYEEANEMCERLCENDINGVNSPIILEERGGNWYIEYQSRSGKTYTIHHAGTNPYYDIVFTYPEDSSLADEFAKIIAE